MKTIVKLSVLAAAVLALAAGNAYGEETSDQFMASDESYPEAFSGSNELGGEAIVTEAGSIECATSVSGTLSEASQTIVLQPEFSECKAFGFVSATVDPEECVFELTIEGVDTEETGAYDGSTDLSCPEGQDVKVTAGTCEMAIGPWSFLKKWIGRLFGGGGGGTPLIQVNIHIGDTYNITYNVKKDGFLCPFNGTGKKEDGEWESSSPLPLESEEGLTIG